MRRLALTTPSRATGSEWVGAIYLGRRASFIRHHRGIVTTVVLATSVCTCGVLCACAGWPATGHVLGHVSWWFIGVMVIAHLGAYGGYLVGHHHVVNRARSTAISWLHDAQLVMIGFGGWLIGGGFTVDRNALQAAGESSHDATISTIVLGLVELLVLSPIAFVCALILTPAPGIPDSLTGPWIVGVPLGFVLVLGSALVPVMNHPRNRVLAVISLVGVATRDALGMLRHPNRGLLVVAGVALYWMADIVALWAAMKFFSTSISLPRLILAYATGYILTRRTLPFAGVVVIEVLLALSLWSVGVPLAVSVLAVLVYRLSDFALTLGTALLASSRVERTLTIVAAAEATARQELEALGDLTQPN